jgi:hexosaminidase
MRLAVVPAPRAWRAVGDPFTLRDDIRVSGDPVASAALIGLVAARTGVRLTPGEPVPGAPGIVLRASEWGPAESYRMRVASSGVTIEAPDAAGLFYGAQTLVQSLAAGDGGWTAPGVEVDDEPRFAYRGMMLDVARHFFPVDVVERLLDRIAALKLNHLHLHLTDDQGWRIALDSRPELARRASATSVLGDPGGFYTRADYTRIVDYARDRHITVVPEIDLPGHTHAVGLAYPALVEEPVVSAAVRETAATFGGGIPTTGEPYTGFAVGFSSLRIRDEATYAFLADVLGELAALTPGPFLHIGGDEALGTSPEDYARFVERVTALVADLGKTPVAWHEAGAVASLAPGTIGQYWSFVTPAEGADEKTRGFVARGGRVILSPADAVYLDMKPRADSRLGLTWANGPTSVERSYSWEPTAVVEGITEADILGVEAALWTETIATENDLEDMVFPRIASAAEIAWSPATGPDRTWPAFRERLAALSVVWADAGIRAGSAEQTVEQTVDGADR